MLSAPHGVEHTRAGRVKPAEVQTSDLARDLHRSLHCPVIIKTKSNDDDPNYDEHSPYRDALVDYVKENDARVVFDLHQLSSEREAAFILGTGGWQESARRYHVVDALPLPGGPGNRSGACR